MSVFSKYSFLFCLIVVVNPLFAQSTSSPFSTFGIGERYSTALTNNQGMAGVGVSQPQFWYTNNQNPALLVYNNLTFFHAGLAIEQRAISSDTLTEKTKAGNMNYLVTSFPVKWNRWVTSFAISPYTTVKYNLKSVEFANGTGERFDKFEQGSGGITQVSWSNGVRLTPDLSVGVRASYLFGSIFNLYQNRSQTPNQPLHYYATIEDRSYVKDFIFGAGVSFSKDSLFSRDRFRLSFGAYYEFAGNLTTRTSTMLYRSSVPGNNGVKIDLDTLTSTKGIISIPPGLTAGVALSRGDWSLATEFSYYDWSSFKSVNADDEGLKESFRIAIGGEMTPDTYSENYLKRMTYRLGASVEELPYLANNQKVHDLGINFGMSLPAGRSSLDLGFRYGRRGNRTENLLEENYFRIYFGLSFNDQWFIQRKFD